jgi:hypothetical protein
VSSALVLQEVEAGALRLQCSLDVGLHCLLDSDPQQAALVVDLLSGALRPRRGSILLGGRAVGHGVASLPARVTLPRVAVGQLLGCVIAARSLQCTAGQLLESWQRPSWWDRRGDELDANEQRALALMLALAPAREAPRLLALYEPFNLGLSHEAIARALHSAERAGAVVLLVTPSARALDRPPLQFASRLQLQDARLVPWAPAASAQGAGDPLLGPAHVVVQCADARRLAASLSLSPAVTTLRFDESANSAWLELYGSDLHALAVAVNEAAVQTDSAISLLSHEPWAGEQIP